MFTNENTHFTAYVSSRTSSLSLTRSQSRVSSKIRECDRHICGLYICVAEL